MNASIKLVVPPFVPANQPSLGVGSLVAVLREAGFKAQAYYLNLDYLQRIGEELYNNISRAFRGSFLSGEYLFTPALWPETNLDWNGYEKMYEARRDEKLLYMGKEGHLQHKESISFKLSQLHAESEQVITGWAEELLTGDPLIIGFSTTFQQTIPSLALARKIKELSNGRVTTILGGANCRGDMGKALFDNFPWLDHVVSGEGEGVIVPLVKSILDQDRIYADRNFIESQPVADLDQFPTPNFDDYFSKIAQGAYPFTPQMAAESSRGCWWGSKSHCTFCGLNGEDIKYRYKSAEKFISEIHELHDTYKRNFFMMTDNIVHPHVVGALHQEFRSSELRFFYEIKANQSKAQLVKMMQAGIHHIQPGIENLSSSLLKQINKGTSQLQNIQTLKYCTELGMVTSWNILYNLPGETEKDYQIHFDLIPKLLHLVPPSIISMRLERFSSYWRDPERYELDHMRHAWPYDFIFHKLPPSQRQRLACYFDYTSGNRNTMQRLAKKLIAAVDRWRQAPRATTLLIIDETFNGCSVIDSRTPQRKKTLTSPPERELLMHLDTVVGIEELFASLQQNGLGGEKVNREQLANLLNRFQRRHWVINEHDNWLSLVIDPSLKYRVHQPESAAA